MKKTITAEKDGKRVVLELDDDGIYREAKPQSENFNGDKNEDSQEKTNAQSNFKKSLENFPIIPICVLIYLCLGFIWELWYIGWLVFFAVPIFMLAVKGNYKSVFVISLVAIYLYIGIKWYLWHPGWLIFFTLPVFYSFTNKKGGFSKSEGFYTLFVLIVYQFLGFYLELWHPGWLIFLTIPIFSGIVRMIKKRKNEQRYSK